MDDKLNCIKNLMRMMCCDGRVAKREKKFLKRAAKEIGLQVSDWNGLLKEVLKDAAKYYPVQDREKAIATLKSLVVMAKADKKVDEHEKKHILRFAKSIGVSNEEWKCIRKDIDVESLFDPFKDSDGAVRPKKIAGAIVVLREDFDKINEFSEVANENGVTTRIVGFDEFMAEAGGDGDIVCFHASQDKDVSVRRCEQLLERSGDRTVSVLTRYQGHQVKYMLEVGLKKCIIEPVYSQDIDGLFKKK